MNEKDRKNKKKTRWKRESLEKKVRECMMGSRDREEGVKLEDVRWLKKAVKGWTVIWVDKNEGMLFVCCSEWYRKKVKETFE